MRLGYGTRPMKWSLRAMKDWNFWELYVFVEGYNPLSWNEPTVIGNL